MALRVFRRAHRVIVRERDEGYARRFDASLHRQRHGRDVAALYRLADQSYGLVAERSGRGQEHHVHAVVGQLSGYFGGGFLG